MSVEAEAWAWAQPGLSMPEKLILVRLGNHANAEGTCWPGKDSLCNSCSIKSRRTVENAIKSLEEKGLLRVERRQKNGRNLVNLYHLKLHQIPLFNTAGNAVSQEKRYRNSDRVVPQEMPKSTAGDAGELSLELSKNSKYSATGVAGREQGYKSKSGKTLSGKALDQFEYFWKIFHEGWEKRGKAEAADEWYQLTANRELPPGTWSHIIAAAKAEAKGRAARLEKGLTPPMASRWLSARRFEDYDPPAPNTQARDDRPRQWYETWDGITGRALGYGLSMYQCDDELDLLDKLIAQLREKRDGVPQGLLDYREVIAKRVAA